MHFMQPGSTTIPYCFTSACTRTFEVQVAVQWPHWLHAGVTRILPGDNLSASPKIRRKDRHKCKSLFAQKVDGHETADEKKWDGHRYRGKRLPEIGGHQMMVNLGISGSCGVENSR